MASMTKQMTYGVVGAVGGLGGLSAAAGLCRGAGCTSCFGCAGMGVFLAVIALLKRMEVARHGRSASDG